MRTPPPDLAEADLRTVLADRWQLTDVTLGYAPVGFGGHHWTAAVGDGARWFVTAQRDRGGLTTALEVAADLEGGAGLSFVVASQRGQGGDLLAPCGAGYLVSVTRFLTDAADWPAAAEASAADRVAVVELTAALHDATIATEPEVDAFEIDERHVLEESLDELGQPWHGSIYAEGIRGRLRTAEPRLREALGRYDELVGRVEDRAGPGVVTHGEIKPGNLLTTPAGPALVDWDTVLSAPPERDLWRLSDPADLAAYTALTGHAVDPDALELYRVRWDLTDIALYVADLSAAPVRTADTDIAWRELRRLLA